jgi:sialate O-acetylesterase
MLRISLFALLCTCFMGYGRAEVKLPGCLSSHMVLQREQPIHIWGWSAPEENVSVAFHGISRDTVGDDLGQWSVYLPPEPAGGPYALTISATNRIVLEDVLVGDVWFASGQSNMEMPLSGWPGAPLKDSAEEIANADHPRIRLFQVPKKSSDFPLRDSEASWVVCTPKTAAGFSAAAYFFGRDIEAREQVPVGLIHASWGGTPAEAWLSLEAIASDAGLMPLFAARAQMMQDQADVPAMRARDRREDQAARAAGKTPPPHTWHPDPASWAPAGLFNAMVAPFRPFPIRGVIWYQGESNSRPAFAPLYVRLFPALIKDWRRQWREGDFPFLFVQISSYNADPAETWPTIREAQRRTLGLANTAMAVTIDIGTPDNVHPPDKQTVGARLALAARALTYGEDIEYSGPLFRQARPEGESMRVWFTHTADGLVAEGDKLEGFQVAGSSGQFVDAQAHIDGRTIIVSSPGVTEPQSVRYGWANVPKANLFNSAGLPASPFTSEKYIPRP